VSCAQVFYYFQHYSDKDGFWTKAAVRLGTLLFVLSNLTTYNQVISSMASDTLHQVFICHSREFHT